MINLIVATDQNGGIGKDNQLLWHLPNDLKRFKALTLNHPIIMGRKTFESIGRALPKRTNVILTRNTQFQAENCLVFDSLDKAIAHFHNEDIFIIGGAEIYKQSMEIADKIYLTLVDTVLEADAFFPEIKSSEWKASEQEHHAKDAEHIYDFDFINYTRQ